MGTTVGVAEIADLPLAEVLGADLPTQLVALESLVDAITAASPVDAARPTTSGPSAPSGHAASAPAPLPEADVLADASVRTRRAVERLEATRLAWLCEVDADGRWALEVFRSFAQWVAWSHGTSVATARREVALARSLRDHLPATAAALRAGTIGTDHARIMANVAATTEPRRNALSGPARVDRDDLRTGEDVLVDLATSHRPEAFRKVAQHFAALADPDATDRALADAAEREFVDLAATLGGYHLAGFLTTEHGQALSTALTAVMGVPPQGDPRTPGRRRAQGLADLARLTLDHGLTGAGSAVRPHLNVTVSLGELTRALIPNGEHGASAGEPAGDESGLGDHTAGRSPDLDWTALIDDAPARWLDGTGPVPPHVLRRLACDGELTRVVFGPDSQILNVGRRERTVSGAKRQAVIARDRECVWPTCNAPPPQCEIHHAITHWADDGLTSTDNAALLCWFHHDHVDTQGITMSFTAGTWTFTRRDGRVITDGSARPRRAVA